MEYNGCGFSKKDIGSYVFFSGGPWYVRYASWLVCRFSRPKWLNSALLRVAICLSRKSSSGGAFKIVDVKSETETEVERP